MLCYDLFCFLVSKTVPVGETIRTVPGVSFVVNYAISKTFSVISSTS